GHVSSGLAGLMISTTPFFAMALGYFYLGDKSAAHPKNILGLVFGFIGVGLLVGVDAFANQLDVLWVLACIGAAFGYAIAPAVAAKNASDVPTVGILALAMATTAVLYAIPAMLNPFETGVTSPKVESWISLLVLGIVCSAIAFVLYFALMKEISYSRSSLITYVNTAVAILAGVFFGSEAFTIGMAIGLPLVAIGSYLASKKHA
ncbi:MAG: DMT family transporter, partial [Micrococcales bacterium]